MAGARAQRVNAGLLRNRSADILMQGAMAQVQSINNLFGNLTQGIERRRDREERAQIRKDEADYRTKLFDENKRQFDAREGRMKAEFEARETRHGLEYERNLQLALLAAAREEEKAQTEAASVRLKVAQAKQELDALQNAVKSGAVPEGAKPGLFAEIQKRLGFIKENFGVWVGLSARAGNDGSSPEAIAAQAGAHKGELANVNALIKRAEALDPGAKRNAALNKLYDSRAQLESDIDALDFRAKRAEADRAEARAREIKDEERRRKDEERAAKNDPEKLFDMVNKRLDNLRLDASDPARIRITDAVLAGTPIDDAISDWRSTLPPTPTAADQRAARNTQLREEGVERDMVADADRMANAGLDEFSKSIGDSQDFDPNDGDDEESRKAAASKAYAAWLDKWGKYANEEQKDLAWSTIKRKFGG